MIIVAGVMLYPFVVMLVTSFKTESQYLIGHGSSLQSWKDLNQTLPVAQELLNSTIICSASIFIVLVVGGSASLRYR